MKKLLLMFALVGSSSGVALADQVIASSTEPSSGIPEHLFQMKNGGGLICSSTCVPTQKEANYGLFAFYKVSGKDEAYYIYSYKAKKWLHYTKNTSYSACNSFISLTETQDTASYFKVHAYESDKYEIQPYTTNGKGVSNYLNWYRGINSNPYDGQVTLGIWTDNGKKDGGSCWIFTELNTHVYTLNLPSGTTVTIGGKSYSNGDTIHSVGTFDKSSITVPSQEGKFSVVSVNDAKNTITVRYISTPSDASVNSYTKAVLYPEQQSEVGTASLKSQEADGTTVYTFKNNVLSASYVKAGDALFFGGCKAMNLEPGTEPFQIAFGSGDVVPASGMTLKDVKIEALKGNKDAVGGAEHYDGQALVAKYQYAYKDSVIDVEWRAVLRDGSHYLRSEMSLKGENAVKMYNIIPMLYNVDTKTAGSMPAVVGNTRGAVILSDKIFAGLENPTGYNTVGDADGSEANYDLTETKQAVSLTKDSWKQVAQDSVPPRVTEATGKSYPNVLQYTVDNLSLKANQKVEVTVTYKSGNHKLNLGGAELLKNGSSVATDFHSGSTGNEHSNNTFSMIVPSDGTYSIRVYIENKTEVVDASSDWVTKVYTPKKGVTIKTDIVSIKGRWSRNTTLPKGDTWKISSVVGLVAQDGKQGESDIAKTQKRRSFLAYSERERAVPWRAFPAYITWYELQINRNNAPNPVDNTKAEQVLDVERHWLNDFYNRYKVGPKAFVIDDGWDEYGTWKFHAGFPNEMKDMADSAKTMNAGVGAWLGPVGGYGTSGDYRRNYWKDKGGMQLSNPAYYQVFKDAAYNLTKNQGDFRFFKFDGISPKFSATGPDPDNDTGNENAEGIIKLEQFVRDSLRRDIFFNTTVGTWASPFWYHYTDATWRQENDYGESANSNSIDRERWITYRDHLVYQNYVTRSPICPINTLMTHGFILSTHGAVSKDMSYNAVLRELRAAFVCGSGMVELYNDYALMNSINNGALWADLAECIKWQQRNADVLPDAHWVGGDPWDGSKANVYGWASWNGKKATLALRNGANGEQSYTFTLREALNIPATVQNGTTIILSKSFGVQDALSGLTEGQPISIDQQLTAKLPASSLFCFDGVTGQPEKVSAITITSEGNASKEAVNKTLVLLAVTNSDATFPALQWESSNTEVATVVNGLVVPVKEGEVTITAKATDGSNVSQTFKVTVTPKAFEPYACNFDKNDAGSQHNRYITSVTLTPKGKETQTLTVGNSHKPYVDKVSEVLTCNAGDTLTVNFNISGGWMHAYVYIDMNQDSIFQFRPNTLDQTGTDVMTYSFYSGSFANDNSGQNSAGTKISGGSRDTRVCPPFKAPTQPGTYRIRFKLDWNSVDPGGQVGSDGTLTQKNAFFATSGEIVDATLEVKPAATGIAVTPTNATQEEVIYDLQGRRLDKAPAHGVYIVNGKKVAK